jgi:hypothetical protein
MVSELNVGTTFWFDLPLEQADVMNCAASRANGDQHQHGESHFTRSRRPSPSRRWITLRRVHTASQSAIIRCAHRGDAMGHTAEIIRSKLENESLISWAIAGDHEFTNALVMPGATHLEHVQSTGHFTANLHILKQQDRVSNRGDMGVSDGVTSHELFGGIRKEAGNLFLLGIAGHTDHKLAEGVVAHTTGQGRQGVDRHPRWLELTDFRFNDLEVIFQTRGFGISTNDFQQPVLLHLLKINAPTGGIPQQLSPGFLVGKQDGPLFAGQASSINLLTSKVLPVPVAPVARMIESLKKPPPHISSRRGTPELTRTLDDALGEAHRPQREDADAMGSPW